YMADLNIPTDIAPAEQAPARNPIFSIAVAILKNTNFFRAFTTSSTIPAIYIQQFWDTMCFNSSTGLYSCQLDEQWLNLHKDILRDALDITPAMITIPSRLHLLSHPVYDQHVPHRKNLATEACKKKKTLHLLIPNVRFTKLIIHHLRTKHNLHPRTGLPLHYSHKESVLNSLRFVGKDGRDVFGMQIPDALLIDEITTAPYYSRYLEHVAEYQHCLDKEHYKEEEQDVTESPKAAKATKSKTAKQTKPSTPKRFLKLVDEFVDEGVPEQEPVYGDEEADIKRAVELSIKEQAERTQGPARLVVIRETDFGRIQPLPDVQGKGRKKRNSTMNPLVHVNLLHLYAELGFCLTVRQNLLRKYLLEDLCWNQDEGQAGPNPGIQDEGKAGSNPGDAAESQPQSSHVVHAGPNLEHMDFEVTNASTQQNPEQMDEEFTIMAYPSVQENLKLPTEDQVRLEEPASSAGTLSSLQNLNKELSFTNKFLVEKYQEDEHDKSNTEAEVQSMVTVPIHQDTSLVPLMTTSVIDLTMSQHVSTMVQAPLPTSTSTVTVITTTTSILPPPPQPQQSIADPILNLEKLDIPYKVKQAVDEIVTDAVDWAMQAPLRARFRTCPASGAQGTPRASGSSQLPPPLPPPSTGTFGSTPQQGREAPSSSKTTVSAQQSMAWTTFDTRYESTGIVGAQELSPSDDLMHDDSVPDEQPLPEEEIPVTPELSWTILPSNVSDVENNWASALASSYKPPVENSLLAKTSDMTTFLNWYCHQINKSKLTQAELEGQAYEVVKVISIIFQFWTDGSLSTAVKFGTRNLSDFDNGLKIFKLCWFLNSLVYSLHALSTLRRFSLRTASAAAKPCQGDSLESYLITGIPNGRW
ncbi:hypothetical protein Tco_1013805, partial [Tanacetum coccineum]